MGGFTFLVTVYYANILRTNWINCVFIEEKRLLHRLINITVPVSERALFSFGDRNTIRKMEVWRRMSINYSIVLNVVAQKLGKP